MKMTPPPKIVRAVRYNAALRARYYNRMLALVREMHDSAQYWIKASYRAAEPLTIAQDASPSAEMLAELQALKDRWFNRFDLAAKPMASYYLKGAFKASDRAMQSALKDVGWTVQFQATPVMTDAFNASLAENVGLIKSIPVEYYSKIEGIMTRSYAFGRDLQQITADLKALNLFTRKRIALIARDQSNKANSIVQRARNLEIGLTEAKWIHSSGGKVPRPSHVKASGTVYKIEEGCLIDGEYIQPGYLVNCRCVCRSLLPH